MCLESWGDCATVVIRGMFGVASEVLSQESGSGLLPIIARGEGIRG